MYQVIALSAIKQAGIPTERLHADITTISFYGEYDTEKLKLTDEERAELLQIERGYNNDGRPECKQVVVGQIVNEAGSPVIHPKGLRRVHTECQLERPGHGLFKRHIGKRIPVWGVCGRQQACNP